MIKLISTTEQVIHRDRDGVLSGYMQIEVQVIQDSTLKQYRFEAFDYLILNKDTPEESKGNFLDRSGTHSTRKFFKTYAEFDSERAQLEVLYPNETGMIPSEYLDYILAKGFLHQLIATPIAGFEFVERIPNITPVV